MALTMSNQQYQTLEQLFAEVYHRAMEAQSAAGLLRSSWDGPVSVSDFELTQAQLDTREQKLKRDWADVKTVLIARIDAVLGV